MQFAMLVDFAPMAILRSAFRYVGGLDEGMSEPGMCGICKRGGGCSRVIPVVLPVLHIHPEMFDHMVMKHSYQAPVTIFQIRISNSAYVYGPQAGRYDHYAIHDSIHVEEDVSNIDIIHGFVNLSSHLLEHVPTPIY